MPATDPRERYDDLRVTESRQELPPEEFAEFRDSEPAAVGWVVLGFVFDDAGRVLLIEQPWAEGWLTPGGAPKPGEPLADAVEREIREETGVEITPERPHAVDELTVVHEESGETGGWSTVFFEATAETTAIDDDLGLEDEEILDADWFDGLPENVFNPDLTRAAYRRCRDGVDES